MSPSRRFLQPINLSGISSDPLSASAGDIYFNSASSTVRYFDGTEWKDVGAGGAGVTVSETAPENPVEGQGWFKSSTSELFFWDGSFWVEATSMVDNFLLFTVSASAPADPLEGSGWFDNTEGNFYIYDGTYWQQVTSVVQSIYGFTVGSTPPESPVEGAGWFNNVEGEFYIYDGTYWQEVVRTVIVDLSQDTSPELSGNLSASGFGIDDLGYIDFDLNPSASPVEGRVLWDATYDTLSVGLHGGSVLQVGQEIHIHVFNDSGDQIDDGMVVYATGIQGDRITVAPAIADGSIEAKFFLGIATQNIADQDTGYVTWFGKVNDVAGTFSNGSVLYASPTTPGALTTTEPTAPNLKLPIAFVIRQHGQNMDLMVRMTQGFYLADSHDANISSLVDNDILSYDSSASVWVNQNLATAIGEVDGAGSGIDADLLDGQHGSYYTGYADTVSASALGLAESYADTVAASALSEANSYTDTASASIISIAEGYSDTVAASALSAANSYTDTSISNLIDSAPATLDTLNELAAALNDDANFATTVTNSLATKLDASTASATYAPIDSPSLTGVPLAPTAASGTSTTQIATTEFVQTEIAAFDALPDQTGNSGKYLSTDGTNTSWETVDALPDQTGNDGKYLTTDGTNASWTTVQSGSIQTDVALSQSWWLGV